MSLGSAHAPPHILLVDDSCEDLALIQQSCVDSNLPARFHLARTAAEALGTLDRLLQQGARIGLIVLDILLPPEDGFRLLQEMRRRPDADGVPLLILSASADMGHVRRGFRLGADLYLFKPVVYDDHRIIAQRMAELLQRQGERSEASLSSAPG